MNPNKKNEKEIQKELLEFIRMMDGLGPVGLSYLTHATNEDRDLALFYLKPMEKKKWITSIAGHMENKYQITKKGLEALDDMMVESAKIKLSGDAVDEIITKENVLQKSPKKEIQNNKKNKNLESKQWDVFISHASEDKETVAKPFADKLQSLDLNV
ncbi:MAG: hypothetical protein IIC67_12535 [Thaumarchaeota archaeon]|nr:hypothetical protein [Nitrososphaerota archaeon]